MNTSSAYVQFLIDSNKMLRESLKEQMAKCRMLEENLAIATDELRAWDNTKTVRGWLGSLIYPMHPSIRSVTWHPGPAVPPPQDEMEDLPF